MAFTMCLEGQISEKGGLKDELWPVFQCVKGGKKGYCKYIQGVQMETYSLFTRNAK